MRRERERCPCLRSIVQYLLEIIDLQNVLVLQIDELVDVPLLVAAALVEGRRPHLEPGRTTFSYTGCNKKVWQYFKVVYFTF